MAKFDDACRTFNNFNGYMGNPPSNEAEYNELLAQQNLFTGSAPSWSDLQPLMVTAQAHINRREQYPQVKEQLDKLYHDIANGNLNTNGEFYRAIKAVKDANPKS